MPKSEKKGLIFYSSGNQEHIFSSIDNNDLSNRFDKVYFKVAIFT